MIVAKMLLLQVFELFDYLELYQSENMATLYLSRIGY